MKQRLDKTSHPIWLRRGLIGLGLAFLISLLLANWLIPHRVTQNIDDTVEMRNVILKAVPIGTSLDDAQRFMEKQGFACKRVRNSTYGDLKGIDYLSCGRSEGMVVQSDWSVVIVHRDGKVTDVIVHRRLTGP